MTKLQAIRGMHDILMHEIPKWQFVEESIKNILNQYVFFVMFHDNTIVFNCGSSSIKFALINFQSKEMCIFYTIDPNFMLNW